MTGKGAGSTTAAGGKNLPETALNQNSAYETPPYPRSTVSATQQQQGSQVQNQCPALAQVFSVTGKNSESHFR